MWSIFKKSPEEVSKTENRLSTSTNSKFTFSMQIPEPTKSLLWISDEDTSKMTSVHQYTVTIDINKGSSSDIKDESYGFHSEPSLIWTKLPVESNNELETQAMYYPNYSGLSPKHRYQYLNWLRDITQETNLSYVFLYFYGLERHMLTGNYDLAVEEVLRLIKAHDKKSFRTYAINSLILASGYKKRPDIIKKASFILDDPSPASLYLQYLSRDPLSAKELINLANRVKFTNKRYLKEEPELFEQELQLIINKYQHNNGDIWDVVDLSKIKEDSYSYIANYSIPDEIRNRKIPSPINDEKFIGLLKELLTNTHYKIKEIKKK